MTVAEALPTPRQLLRDLTDRFAQAGIASAAAEAAWLLSECLGAARTELYLDHAPLAAEPLDCIEQLASRRIAGEPLQYVLGATEFLGHRLAVAPGVFIPRPETEILAQRALEWLRARARLGGCSPLRVLELGAGTGALAIALAAAVPSCVVAAVELSWHALRIAQSNVRTHGLMDRIHLIHADWAEPLAGRFDLIVSNPPYVPSEATAALMRARLGDPAMSLDGGPDGQAFYRRLAHDAPRLLAPRGALGCECGEDQAASLQTLFAGRPWVQRAEQLIDLAGRPRSLWIDATTSWTD